MADIDPPTPGGPYPPLDLYPPDDEGGPEPFPDEAEPTRTERFFRIARNIGATVVDKVVERVTTERIKINKKRVNKSTDKLKELEREKEFSMMLGEVASNRVLVTAEGKIKLNAKEARAKANGRNTAERPFTIEDMDSEDRETWEAWAYRDMTPYNQEIVPVSNKEKQMADRLAEMLQEYDASTHEEAVVHRTSYTPGPIDVKATEDNKRRLRADIESSYKSGEINDIERTEAISRVDKESIQHKPQRERRKVMLKSDKRGRKVARYATTMSGTTTPVTPRRGTITRPQNSRERAVAPFPEIPIVHIDKIVGEIDPKTLDPSSRVLHRVSDKVGHRRHERRNRRHNRRKTRAEKRRDGAQKILDRINP